jgi:uncharacterized protein
MTGAFQDRFSRLAALKPARGRAVVDMGIEARGLSPDIPGGSARLAELLGAMAARNRFGEHLALRRWFSESIGCEPPERAVDEGALRLLSPDIPADALNPEKWLFLDTETTGLAGGTGTYAFLVGIAWWDAGGLEVEQFFMRDHSEEHSLLVALAERMVKRPVLVTFNGKSFDWPLLETRFRLTRTIRPPTLRAHLDFLHPARNLWRLRLGSVRLAELERHVLGWNRGVDIDSSLIPAIYFDFLRGGSPDPLVPIFWHNQMDLRGLAGLAAHTLSLLAEPERGGIDALELLGVSRICERRGETERARELYERSLARELPADACRTAQKSLARIARRNGDFQAACALWQALLGPSREGLEAYEHLAIHYERRLRDLRQAIALVHKALADLRRTTSLGTLTPALCSPYRKRFEKRLARLETKARRALLQGLREGGENAESQARIAESNLGKAAQENSDGQFG